MPKVTKKLGNNKARAWESLGFAHKKSCASILTQPPGGFFHHILNELPQLIATYWNRGYNFEMKLNLKQLII
ncbi:hypothetical protein NXX87_13375 [Bacteroides faecis]|uniref:hypothetical protein n=1 Tax=Bacteroides faecis TaxID=674529 RepID=UPI0021642279|nr:hypothetical protein [Bacteroides faecis]UVS36975.1 hypothetical protein NXX87_13375 [Bacteroides faecis]